MTRPMPQPNENHRKPLPGQKEFTAFGEGTYTRR